MKDIKKLANIEAEEAIIGGILLDPNAFSRVKEQIHTAMFSVRAHKIIYKAIKELGDQEKPTDLTGVSTYLADRELYEVVGGGTKLGQLLNRTVSATNIDRYAQILIEKWKRRKLVELSNELEDLAYATELELPDLIQRVFEEVEEWIGDEEVKKEPSLNAKMTYTARTTQKNQNYDEIISLEAEIDLTSDPLPQIKKLKEQAESCLARDDDNKANEFEAD